eukprot:5625406-Lingulodinium_polyedra.AAC.1
MGELHNTPDVDNLARAAGTLAGLHHLGVGTNGGLAGSGLASVLLSLGHESRTGPGVRTRTDMHGRTR